MAIQMPIPQDPGQEPINDFGDLGDESVHELFDEENEVEELADGSAIVHMDDMKGPDESPRFYANLADEFDPLVLDKIALKYLELIEKDREAREERDKQYEDGLRRTGMGNDAPGGAQFSGASKVVHPAMAEGCVDFAARAIKELFPPEGPVKTKIHGEATEDKEEKADRKKNYMNWQLTEQVEEYRDELEQLLTQLPLGGSQYLKMWYDEDRKRPCAEFLPIDNVYLPFAATNFYTAERATEVNDIVQEEYERRVSAGLYRDVDVYRTSMEPEQSQPERANDKIEGRAQQADNVDGLRRVYHVYTWLGMEDDKESDGERAPYILMIDDTSNEVVGLYRNWEDGDKNHTKLDWVVEFKFIPWRGAYAIGLPHLIGGLSAALTGALRALLDTAHINNTATMLKLKGGKTSGQSVTVEPTQVVEIEAAPGIDDIRKIAMPMPFNPPSVVLFQLLGWLSDAAKGVVTTSEEKIADITSNAPVGTTQALIEQGAAVYSSIHARLHASEARVLKILGRLNRWYVDENPNEMSEEYEVTSADFEKNTDVVPVSDPHIFSETQRYAQVQTLAARAQAAPDLYNRLAVEKRILKQIKLPDINEVLPDPQNVKDMNPALENVAMTIGKPVGAFPVQDHLAHLRVHLTYALDPLFGANPIMAPAFIPGALEHIKQHLTLWYLNHMDSYTSAALGRPFNVLKVEPIPREAQALLAAAGQHVHLDGEEQITQIVMPAIQQMMQMMQQLKSQMQPQDPNVQALVMTQTAETQRKAADDNAQHQIDMAKIAATTQDQREDNVTAEQIAAAKILGDANVLTIERQHEQELAQQQQAAAAQQAAQQQSHEQELQAQAAQQQPPQMGQPGQMPQPPQQSPQGANNG